MCAMKKVIGSHPSATFATDLSFDLGYVTYCELHIPSFQQGDQWKHNFNARKVPSDHLV